LFMTGDGPFRPLVLLPRRILHPLGTGFLTHPEFYAHDPAD
jgi:hypothetical protein